MKRRELLSKMALATMAAGVAPLSYPMRALAAECSPIPLIPQTLVNVMLNGGADLRFLFMPAPGTLEQGHEDLIFASRRNMYASSRNNAGMTYSEMFSLEYEKPSESSVFGIHKSCGWLTEQYKVGNVAIVANAYCSRNRRHDQSIINADAGDPEFNELVHDRDGWGGRLIEAIDPGGNGTANAVELGGSISVFNKGRTEGNRLAQVIHAQNVRDIALPDVSETGGGTGKRDVLIRALKGYYSARGQEVLSEKPGNWPFHTFFDHNAVFREFGDEIAARMADCGSLPLSLMPTNSGGTFDLNSNSFEQQCRNLYDICLAPDLFKVRTLSMNYGGWDTHGNEEVRISGNLGDILGTDKGLDRATREIGLLGNGAEDQLVFYFASDFGRQLVANGDFGTDHGRGTYAIVAGTGVNGGVYGDMFPAAEAVENGGKVPLETHGADIFGQTSTENVLAEVCDWMHTGSSGQVFPSLDAANVESPGLLNTLMA